MDTQTVEELLKIKADPIALIAIEIMKVQGDFLKVKDYDFPEQSFKELLPKFLNYYESGIETLKDKTES